MRSSAGKSVWVPVGGAFVAALLLTALTAGCRETQEERAEQSGNRIEAVDVREPDKSRVSAGAEHQPSGGVGADIAVPVAHRSRLRFQPLSAAQFPQVLPVNGHEHGFTTILESLGSGGAAVDLDLDDRPDFVIVGGGTFEGKNCVGRPLFVLRHGGDGYREVTDVAWSHSLPYYSHGITVCDYNNDGFPDCLVTGFGGVTLLRNEGDGTFTDCTEAAGLRHPFWNCAAAWADFNRDGSPDVFVGGYVDWSFENDPPCFARDGVTRDNCSPKLFDAQPDALFVSRQDGTFRDDAQAFGVRGDGRTLGAVAADLDGDQYVDLYVANDVMTNFLYRNRGGSGFEDMTVLSGTGVSNRGSPDASMGVSVADFDLDGLPDLWAANFEMESFAVYRNQGEWLFRHTSDVTGVSAIGNQYVGWGCDFADFDLDGDEDVVVCNGHVVKFPEHAPAMQRMILLENIEGRYFEEVAAQAGNELLTPRNGRGLAVTDWNKDGRPDLLITPVNSPAMVLQNETKTEGTHLSVRLIGTRSSRMPFGATLYLHTSCGLQTRVLEGGGSYASASDQRIRFGLPAGCSAEKLTIRWPSGSESTHVPSGQNQWTIVEPRS